MELLGAPAREAADRGICERVDDFLDLDEVTARLLSYQDRYNLTAHPFDWTFTRDDLNRSLTLPARGATGPVSYG